ncbi:MAG: (2Fe-2S)-binding protein [Bdellovibrionales bacterium]|nr:(2Fe-2S)-binding protein [Bdellovibrionales bacterium]
MPKCKINGQEVEVAAGSTIIQAYKAAGIDICHYCWHPGLSVAGVCRLCMVQIEGMPKLQIACNTEVKEGMVINNTSEVVKDTVKWGLDFHLINHPLDCPICDQAGECGLQDQYMQFGKYDPEMAEAKVKKHKVVDLGPTVVLDAERCILCSRCVRFTEEVSKTNELGIFNRGDRSEIGTVEGKPLDNNYSLNTVDICPVGALTSRDFRFRQRVWYLKEADSVCPGCSTGCSVKVHYNEEGLWRVKPRENKEVNGYWMCDTGRDTYKFVNLKARLLSGRIGKRDQWQEISAEDATRSAGLKLRETVQKHGPDSVALVVTGQYTNEEYKDLLKFFTGELKSKNVYHWLNNPEKMKDFDGLLFRGDRNPNTMGLSAALAAHGVSSKWETLQSQLSGRKLKMVVVAGPENQATFPDMKEKIQMLSQADGLIWLTAGLNADLNQVGSETWQVPLKAYVEKAGSFTNFEGRVQPFKAGTTIVPQALTLSEAVELLAGRDLNWALRPKGLGGPKTNYAVTQRGTL